MKKHFAAILLAMVFTCGAGFAATVSEADQQAQAEAQAQAEFEKPLTRADIDTFLKMAPKLEEAMKDPDALLKLYQDNNVSPQRFGAITLKATIGLALAQGVTREQLTGTGQIPEFTIPGDSEVALIKEKLDALSAAVESIQ